MSGRSRSRQLSACRHDRSVSVVGGHRKVIHLTHAGVADDKISRRGVAPDSIRGVAGLAGDMIAQQRFAICVREVNSTPGIRSDDTAGDGVAAAFPREANQIDAPIAVGTDRTTGDHVAIAPAAIAPGTMDAITAVAPDDAIGDGIAIAVAIVTQEVDA